VTRGLARQVAGAAAALVLLAGCGGAGDQATSGDQVPAATGSSGPRDIADRCLSATPKGRHIEGVTLTGGEMSLRGALLRPAEPNGTAVVMLPQIGPAGLCGWLKFAAHLTDEGITALAIDPCGYGESTCPDALAPVVDRQVELAVAHLDETVHPDRVVLVGASMGGSQTVRAIARGVDVDAWVDVSGPSAWDGDVLLDLAPQVDLPGMIVYARSDGDRLFEEARQLADATGATFVEGPGGHGWDLLLTLGGKVTRVGDRVAAFIAG
jgi:dienelactone hydrolase